MSQFWYNENAAYKHRTETAGATSVRLMFSALLRYPDRGDFVYCVSRCYQNQATTAAFNSFPIHLFFIALSLDSIQDVPGGNVNILESHSISHSKQKSVYVYVHVSYSERFPKELYFTVQYTVQTSKHDMSSHELQSALVLTVEFSKMYYTTIALFFFLPLAL
jgi:hypothetical protein